MEIEGKITDRRVIKRELLKKFGNVEIKEIKKHSFSICSITVKMEMKRTTKVGIVWCTLDHENWKIDFDNKIEWFGSVSK